MLSDFFKRLVSDSPEETRALDSRRALGALLVRIARTDGDYAKSERQQIDRILSLRYELDNDDTAILRAECEVIEEEAPDTVRFTRAIKDGVPYEDRVAVIESLWQVVLADGHRDAGEDALLRTVAPLLGVSDQDSNSARRRVQGSAQ